jgi:N-glycosylase/DNA lyase
LNSLIKEIKKLQKNTELNKIIKKKLKEFKSFKNKNSNKWFSELCFCILTANSKAETALKIQKELNSKGFIDNTELSLSKCIQKNKHRFHNNKAKFICEARKFKNIKEKMNSFPNSFSKREWIVENIKGIGLKEASHFLRNTGHFDLAILDRHVINLMLEYKIIKEKPKQLNKKSYFELEKKLEEIAKKLEITQAELDLFLWFKKTGKVLK